MKQNINLNKKVIALFTVIFILSLLVFNNYIDSPDISPVKSNCNSFNVNLSTEIAMPVTFRTEDTITSNVVKYLDYNSSKKYEHPTYIVYLLNRNYCLLMLICFAFLSAIIAKSDCIFSRKYILKYIHDQDGHKD